MEQPSAVAAAKPHSTSAPAQQPQETHGAIQAGRVDKYPSQASSIVEVIPAPAHRHFTPSPSSLGEQDTAKMDLARSLLDSSPSPASSIGSLDALSSTAISLLGAMARDSSNEAQAQDTPPSHSPPAAALASSPSPSPLSMAFPPPLPPHKVRLSGPIRAHVNLRHGVWAPKLRCRKRKNLHALSYIVIDSTCNIEELLRRVRTVLPSDFLWNERESPLRFQAVNDQSLQSLKPVTKDMFEGPNGLASLFEMFDTVRNRRSDGEGFELQLFVYGTWLRLIRMHLGGFADTIRKGSNPSADHDDATETGGPDASVKAAPKRMKPEEPILPPINASSMMGSFYAHPPRQIMTQLGTPQQLLAPLYSPSPLFVTLEMRMNGAIVPMEVSKQSLILALQSILPTQPPAATHQQ